MALTTSVTLLQKISEGDEVSWTRFHEIYSPLIRMCGQDWGLSAQECDDLVQDVMLSIFKVSKTFRYDRTKGSFRSYLRTVVRNQVFAVFRSRKMNSQAVPENENLLDCAFEEKWETEWHSYLLNEALKLLENRMEKISYRSFYEYAVLKRKPAEVAAGLGITVNAVYINKSRAVEQLRQLVRELEKL